MIKVNGIEGVCPYFNCDYVYVDTTALITGQSISGNSLTITGTNLPVGATTVALANSVCGTVTATTTQITCTLTTPAAAGSWNVRVIDENGLIPIDASVATIDIALSVSALLNGADLNQLGGDILTI